MTDQPVYHNVAELYRDRVLRIGRKLTNEPSIDDPNQTKSQYSKETKQQSIEEQETNNLITSQCEDGLHAPVIDFDIPLSVVPSSDNNHYHLYIDKKITWTQYRQLLDVLASIGLVEQGYVEASISREYSTVRIPGHWKPLKAREDLSFAEPEILLKVLTTIDNVYAANEELAQKNIELGIRNTDLSCSLETFSKTIDKLEWTIKKKEKTIGALEASLVKVKTENAELKVKANNTSNSALEWS